MGDPTDAELFLAGHSLGRVPQTFLPNTVQLYRGSLQIQGLNRVPKQGTAGNVLPWGGRLPDLTPVFFVSEIAHSSL